ncbi:large conductance mechanosensitive channel protein MscL [Alicyclobacillus sp. ALC3]|uniref:large conductance mechanosensitive channel protein MscL n=1 Tax=Alicyclobacillus sp. ALC3 TaxID=2796143 RepID=UPI00237876D3|nr:large conductance mechanosensitive channel protein MscL [Alicyclobacillus sp. ALC3]WDL98311.1 large conductance mechanosensitive channel protein MscL [Alicyclobacillus sp. ALC3]
MWKEFRTFLMRGNVIDLAIGIIIGGAFGKIVTALVNDIIMPPIGLLLGRVNFTDLYINLSSKHYASLAQAQAAGAPTINYGVFINTVLNFLIVALVIFLTIVKTNQWFASRRKKPEPASPTTKPCPYCCSDIPLAATRCPQCTSVLDAS